MKKTKAKLVVTSVEAQKTGKAVFMTAIFENDVEKKDLKAETPSASFKMIIPNEMAAVNFFVKDDEITMELTKKAETGDRKAETEESK